MPIKIDKLIINSSYEEPLNRIFLDEWVRALNTHGGFGKWAWAVSTHPSDLEGILGNKND